jgi:hypothetical protein
MVCVPSGVTRLNDLLFVIVTRLPDFSCERRGMPTRSQNHKCKQCLLGAARTFTQKEIAAATKKNNQTKKLQQPWAQSFCTGYAQLGNRFITLKVFGKYRRTGSPNHLNHKNSSNYALAINKKLSEDKDVNC